MLTLQFVPYHEIESLDSEGRVGKLLGLVKENKIVLMEGRLKALEESKLIETTMTEVNNTFKGIEICTIYPRKENMTFTGRFKKELTKFLLGNKEGMTIIGPASLITDIKRDPNKIQLFASELGIIKKKKKKKRGK